MAANNLQLQSDLNPYTNKGDLAAQVLGHTAFDVALPQQYLDKLAGDCLKKYDALRFGLVVVYSDAEYGMIKPITLDAQNLLEGAQ